jgi:UDP-N-acetylmuramyl pentapeptide synthase
LQHGLRGLVNPPQRLELKTWVKQSQVIDDTYNANPDSMRAAIDVLSQFKGRKVAILGDMAELGRYRKKLHIGFGRLCQNTWSRYFTWIWRFDPDIQLLAFGDHGYFFKE